MIKIEILSEIEEYCELNNLSVNDVVNKSILRGFTILKYGTLRKVNKKPLEGIKINSDKKINTKPLGNKNSNNKLDMYGEN